MVYCFANRRMEDDGTIIADVLAVIGGCAFKAIPILIGSQNETFSFYWALNSV